MEMEKDHHWSRNRVGTLLIVAAVLPAVACSPDHHLAEYDFTGGSLAVVAIAPPRAEVFSDMDLRVDRSDPLGTVLRAGTEIAREMSLEDFRLRLDSAANRVDVSGRMADRTLGDAARYLRARPVESASDADFELELRIRRYGIRADGWRSGAYFSLEGDMLLLDGATGRIIWRTNVRASDPVRPGAVDSDSPALTNVVTAVALSRMSTGEIEQALVSLADFSADALGRAFARALDEAREAREG